MDERLDFDQVTTRGGDDGVTSLYNGERRRKDDLVFEVLGDVDELGSFLGLAKAEALDTELKKLIEDPQRLLFRIGALVATPVQDELFSRLEPVGAKDLHELETKERKLLEDAKIEPAFVLSGATRLSASLDAARTVARRAERHLVALIRDRGSRELADCQRYLNRLSDFLFVLARWSEQKRL